MTAGLQAKLLRFLEEKAFKRVGGARDLRVDVRVVAATNRDLEAEVEAKRFREDLYYRLRVLPVRLPPLRERRGDVALLAKFFLDGFNREFRKRIRGLSAEAGRLLDAHSWPGNVRELRNALERAALLVEGDVLVGDDFDMIRSREPSASGFRLPAEGVDLAALERELVEQALERTGGQQTRAAGLLGLTRDQIRYRIEKYELRSDPASDAE